MAKEAKINYDEEFDILYAYTGEKVKDSLEIGSYVIDFYMDNKIVGIEIMDAMKLLSNFTEVKLNKDILSKIISAKIQVIPNRDILLAVLLLIMPIEGKQQEISVQVPAPIAVMVRD